MIVRIFTEGQYELPKAALPGLHELDEQVQAAVDAGDSQRFHDLYRRLLDHIRQPVRRSPPTTSGRPT